VLIAKMHGAGNDFVVVEGTPPAGGRDVELVRQLADRRRGIGADGVLFLERLNDKLDKLDKLDKSDTLDTLDKSDVSADLRMHFYNSDGGRAGLCLNGARCAALRALQLGWSTGEMRIQTEYSLLHASVQTADDTARVRLLLPVPEAAPRQLKLPDQTVATHGWAVHTGDPHLVVETAAGTMDDFEAQARPLRWWTGPDDAGSNVHFVHRAGDHWTIRSFERGIEGETEACGSGCVAALLALADTAEPREAHLRTHSGDMIEVTLSDDVLALEGPAVCVFTTNWNGDGAS